MHTEMPLWVSPLARVAAPAPDPTTITSTEWTLLLATRCAQSLSSGLIGATEPAQGSFVEGGGGLLLGKTNECLLVHRRVHKFSDVPVGNAVDLAEGL